MSTVYLFYGKSGSGKGTQAEILKTRLESSGKKVIYIETGKLFRAFSEDHPGFFADRIHATIDAGGLMPPFSAIYLWARELIEHYTGIEDIIVDGVARRIQEAPMIDSALEFLNITDRNVVTIDVSDQWVIDHKGKRGRVDDTDEGMKKRLDWFNSEVVPVIEYFKNKPNYKSVTINGEQTIEEVAGEIERALH